MMSWRINVVAGCHRPLGTAVFLGILVILVGCAASIPPQTVPSEATTPSIEEQAAAPTSLSPSPAPTSLSTPAEPTQMTHSPSPPASSPSNELNWQALPQQMITERAFRHYATVERTDGSYRQMFIDETTLAVWTPDAPLPANAFFVMETYVIPDREGTNFTAQMGEDGTFTYGSFSPSRPSFATRRDGSCASCHRGAEDAAGTYTLPMLEVAVIQGQVLTTVCDRSGRAPCGPEVYRAFTNAEAGASVSQCVLCYPHQQATPP